MNIYYYAIFLLQGNRYAMVFVLPHQKHNLDNLIESLTAPDFDKIINTGEDYKCALVIPKFNVSYDLGLTDVLQDVNNYHFCKRIKKIQTKPETQSNLSARRQTNIHGQFANHQTEPS